jgi:hypothetical protein
MLKHTKGEASIHVSVSIEDGALTVGSKGRTLTTETYDAEFPPYKRLITPPVASEGPVTVAQWQLARLGKLQDHVGQKDHDLPLILEPTGDGTLKPIRFRLGANTSGLFMPVRIN